MAWALSPASATARPSSTGAPSPRTCLSAARPTEGCLAASGKKAVDVFSREAVKTYNIKIGELGDAASSLSGGNQQKLVVARWIAVMPDLLLLDDPTKGVDINSRREIHEILRQCARQKNMTVIVSSSDNDELTELAERIYVFYEGRVTALLEGEDKTQERLVAEMMGMGKEGVQEDA